MGLALVGGRYLGRQCTGIGIGACGSLQDSHSPNPAHEHACPFPNAATRLFSWNIAFPQKYFSTAAWTFDGSDGKTDNFKTFAEATAETSVVVGSGKTHMADQEDAGTLAQVEKDQRTGAYLLSCQAFG